MATLPSQLTLPARTVQGHGAVAGFLAECEAFGPRGIVVCGQSLDASGKLRELLGARFKDAAIRVYCHGGGEPTLDQLDELLDVARDHQPDWVLGIGGGSVMDVAKAAAGLIAAPQPCVEYHNGTAIPPSCMPFLAAPTTAGTGSEATIVSVLTNSSTGVKKSIRHPSFMARAVCLDPGLLESCPPRVVACSGMDALTQAIEAFVSRHATWVTDAFALEAVALIHRHLPAVYDGVSGEATEGLLNGSYLAGLALSNARLGLVHGLAHPLGARYRLAHGLVCGLCLPIVLAFNRDAIGEKYARLGEAFGADPLDRIGELLAGFDMESPLPGEGLRDEAAMVEEILASGSTAANPREVSETDARAVLQQLFSA